MGSNPTSGTSAHPSGVPPGLGPGGGLERHSPAGKRRRSSGSRGLAPASDRSAVCRYIVSNQGLVIPTILKPNTCTRCAHRWFPTKFDDDGRPIRTKKCPSCNSPYWDKPRMSKAARAELVAKRTRAYHRRRRAEAESK